MVVFPRNSPCYYEVIVVAHSSDCFDDFTFIVGNDFNSLQVLWTLSALCKTSYSPRIRLTIPSEKHHFAKYAELVYNSSTLFKLRPSSKLLAPVASLTHINSLCNNSSACKFSRGQLPTRVIRVSPFHPTPHHQ